MLQTDSALPSRGIRPAQASRKLGIGLSTLWLKSKTDPTFPQPFKLGPRVTVFYEHELDAYLARAAGVRGGAQ